MSAASRLDTSSAQENAAMLVREQIRGFIRDSFLVDEFTDDDSFLGSGLIDSLGILQLVSFVETQYAIAVADTDLTPDNFDSVARLAAYVERRNRDKAA
jgi:acyl carrier protein